MAGCSVEACGQTTSREPLCRSPSGRRRLPTPRPSALSPNFGWLPCLCLFSAFPLSMSSLLLWFLSPPPLLGLERKVGGLPESPGPGLGLSCCGSGAATSLGSSDGGRTVQPPLRWCPSSWPHSLPSCCLPCTSVSSPFTSRLIALRPSWSFVQGTPAVQCTK